MGKGNRTKKQQAASVLADAGKRSAAKKREMPTWVGTLIVVSVLVVIVLFATFSALNSRGVFLRGKVIYESEHFEITVPMMSYMVYTEYQEWVNTYESTGYMQYIKGQGGQGLNTSAPLRDQIYSSTTDEATGAVTTVTWFDYFAGRATASIQQVLVLCEQARQYGITLDESDYKTIDSTIESVELYAAYSGYTTSGYLSAMYGKGVGEKDVRAMMELTQLATKFTGIKMEEFENGATDVRMEEYYQQNKSVFDIYVDYISYAFEATFKPVSDETENAAEKNAEAYAKFLADKERYQNYITELAACTDAESFSNLLIRYLKEDLKLKNPEKEDDAVSLEALQLQSGAHHIDYKRSDEDLALEDWLFDTSDPVAAGDTNTFKEDKDAGREEIEPEEEGGEVTYEYKDATATYTACYVLKPVHKDDALLQDVGHILFKSDTFASLTDTSKLTGKVKELAQRLVDRGEKISAENMAKELIAVMKEEGKLITKVNEATGEEYYYIEKADFEAYGNGYTEDSNVFYEDVARGDMVKEFDAWLYDDDRILGEVSPAGVKTTYGYHVMYYAGEGDLENWKSLAREKISTADYEEWYKIAAASVTVTPTQKYWSKIN